MGDHQQLLNLLSLPSVLLHPAKQKEAITHLCGLINTDSDGPSMVQPCLQLLSSHQPLTRIVVMKLIQRHVGRDPDIMPQATNALLRCAVDPNPAVRKAAVSTLACVPGAANITLPVVASALRDPHPAVQRAAVVACRVLGRTQPDTRTEHVDDLYRLIGSDDALLVHACLMSLEDILAPEGGVVISRSMVKHLTTRSRGLPDAVLADVLRLLLRYQPSSDTERLAIMNRLDWILTASQPHLLQAVLQLFFHLCSGSLSHLRADAVERAAATLCGLSDSGPALRHLTLDLVQQLGPQHYPAFGPHYRYFVPRPTDGGALSERLVRFLWRLAGPETAAPLVRELAAQLPDERLQPAAVAGLLRLGRLRPDLAAAVTEPLLRLAASRAAAGRLAAALSAADLAPLPAPQRTRLLAALLSQLPQLAPVALCRLLPLLGRWAGRLQTAPARLGQLAARSAELDEPARVALLEAVTRLFLQRPAEFQLLLAQLLELSWSSGGQLRQLAARLYASLLTPEGRTLLWSDDTDGTAYRTDIGGDKFTHAPVT